MPRQSGTVAAGALHTDASHTSVRAQPLLQLVVPCLEQAAHATVLLLGVGLRGAAGGQVVAVSKPVMLRSSVLNLTATKWIGRPVCRCFSA